MTEGYRRMGWQEEKKRSDERKAFGPREMAGVSKSGLASAEVHVAR